MHFEDIIAAMSDKLRDRYRVIEPLSTARDVTTLKAIDDTSGRHMVIRVLELRHITRWKAIELFEREVDALRSFDHRGVPSFVDSWVDESADGVSLGLVREWVDGIAVHDGEWAAEPIVGEDEAIGLARGVAEILAYLHSLRPPVIHRDLTPEHIIRRPDGSLTLVGFGSVRAVLPRTVGGSTFVGTSGYVAPEQLMGRAMPASDIYALGASLVALLTGLDPSSLTTDGARLQYESHLEVRDSTRRLLGAMLAPVAEDRVTSGAALLRLLDAPDASAVELALTNSPPPASVVAVVKESELHIELPTLASRDALLRRAVPIVLGLCALMTLYIGWRALTGGTKVVPLLIATAAVAIPYGWIFRTTTRRRVIRLSPDALRIDGKLFAWVSVSDVRRIDCGEKGYGLAVEVDDRLQSAMTNLELAEADWVVQQIRARLESER